MKDRAKKLLTGAGWLLFYLYIILLCYFLFFSEHYGRDYVVSGYRYNFVLLKEIRRFIEYREQLGTETFIVNILGNVLAFAPFGFFLPALNKKYRKFFLTVFLCMLFSLAVEVVQLVLKVGVCDVDDILLNTVGGIVGYIFYAIIRSCFFKKKPQSKKK